MPPLFETFPVLHTARLNLIQMGQVHIADIYKLFTDQRVTEFFNVIPLRDEAGVNKILDMLDKRYRDKAGIRWGIALKGETRIIGNLGYNSFTAGHRSVIGYALIPQYWNQGLITEAITEIVRYGFQVLEVNRIEAEVIPGNIASERVLGKLGFRHEGMLREWMLFNDKYNDINMYALLRKDTAYAPARISNIP